MSFASSSFALFFTVFFLIYHAAPTARHQNWLIVIGSYIFYGWWNCRLVPLLLAISLVNYGSAIAIERSFSITTRRIVLFIALAISLGALAFFKYYNFFVQSAAALLDAAGFPGSVRSLEIILPLGISFMTFQGLAYVMDVWRNELPAERDLIKF